MCVGLCVCFVYLFVFCFIMVFVVRLYLVLPDLSLLCLDNCLTTTSANIFLLTTKNATYGVVDISTGCGPREAGYFELQKDTG